MNKIVDLRKFLESFFSSPYIFTTSYRIRIYSHFVFVKIMIFKNQTTMVEYFTRFTFFGIFPINLWFINNFPFTRFIRRVQSVRIN